VTTHTDDERVNGARLRKLREAKGLSSDQLARLCSLSVHQVLELENGGTQSFYSTPIKINAARKVAQVLSVDASEFLFEPIPVVQDMLAPEPAPPLQAESGKLRHAEHQSASWAGYLIVLTVLLGAGIWWFQQSRVVSFPSFEPASNTASPVDGAGSLSGTQVQTTPSVDTQGGGVAEAETIAKESGVKPCNVEEEMLVLEAQAPNKPADKVSLMMHRQGELCVQDSTGKVWREDLKPWLGRNFIGTAPWRLTSPVLFYGDVYFQGEKMQIPSQKVHSITLNAKPSRP
jgi:cytoskeleton protein RodZ